jgi:uncharacterized phage protein gp47/JayE
MPFLRPSLPTLIERAIADIETRLPGADARLRRSNFNVLARVSAGAAHGLYAFLDWVARQILPDTAEAEILERHAAIWLPAGRLPAAYAQGRIAVTGADGVLIPADTRYKRADGVAFFTDSEATITAGEAIIEVSAADAGQAGNTDPGVALSLESPIIGIDARATVVGDGLSGGADVETDESLRARIIARIQQPPMGGAAHDYVTWAKEVPGVTRAWVYPLEMGDGTVTVRFVRDKDPNPIPDSNEVAAVQAYIDAARPITAHVYVLAPIAAPVAFVIRLVPNTPVVRLAVEAGLRDLLLREAEPEGGFNEGRLLLSHVREAISLAAGETDHELLSPTANITPEPGQMAVFGSLAWA